MNKKYALYMRQKAKMNNFLYLEILQLFMSNKSILKKCDSVHEIVLVQ